MRYFLVFADKDISKNLINPIGRVMGASPNLAIRIAFKSYLHDLEIINQDISQNYLLTLLETTRNSQQEVFRYSCQRILLDTPVKIQIKQDSGVAFQQVHQDKIKLIEINQEGHELAYINKSKMRASFVKFVRQTGAY